MRALLLGTAGAWPIPRPGCPCAQCSEARADPRLARTRSGLRIETPAGGVLVDTGPDVCWQHERRGLEVKADRVVITHGHLDHVLGLDDVVHVRRGREAVLPVHVGGEHRALLGTVFAHLLRPEALRVRFEAWGAGTRIALGDVVLEGFETGHRERFATTGVLLDLPWQGRHARIAYATDMGAAAPTPAARLAGVDLFVGDGTYLGPPGHGHPGTDRVLAMAQALGARRTVFTHVGHWRVGHAAATERLGEAVAICRDGDDLLTYLPGA